MPGRHGSLSLSRRVRFRVRRLLVGEVDGGLLVRVGAKVGADPEVAELEEVAEVGDPVARQHVGRLEEASCTGATGSRVFSGEGSTSRKGRPGYTLNFSISERAGGFYFQAVVMKGTEVIETTGGPLKSKDQSIS
jgi:hypothetical protein